MAQTIARRSLIIGGASAATLAAVPLALAQDTITVDQFRALSARLTGVAMPDLDVTAAGKLLAGFISLGRGDDLARLAADPGMTGGALGNDIVAAWYSGSYATRAGEAAIDLTKALLWNALDFTKPRGECARAANNWAEPPRN